MRATAFCPGHVTGFFQVCESDDLLKMGSRGAGMCLSLGATSVVTAREAKRPSIQVMIDGVRSRAEVTRLALDYLLRGEDLAVDVATDLDLPQSQGLGMSAAGALSASLAFAKLLRKSRQRAFEAAHIAEITYKSGLGDVSAIHRGGITVRARAGLPPNGRVLRIRGMPEVVIGIVGGKMLTRTVLSNPERKRAINASGSKRVDEIIRGPSLENLMRLSWEFATESGLPSKRVIAAVNAASKLGMASMAMLGSSVFAIGDTEGLSTVLRDFGRTYTCTVDTEGPRII